jgi:amidophosphoribosyltransferase
MRKLVSMIRGAGAAKVHLRIGSPAITHSCYYGIDTPTRGELIASSHSVEEIRQYLGVDSLHYLSREGLLSCVDDPENYCTACFCGDYPVERMGHYSKDVFDEKAGGVKGPEAKENKC